MPPIDDNPSTKPVQPSNENRAPYHARSRGAKPNSATAAPRTLQPNALLHRSLNDVRKERASEAMTAPGAANAALQARVTELESKLASAEELGDALLLSQQALLTEKARLQAENAQLAREAAALRERLDFLHLSFAGGEVAAQVVPAAAEPSTVIRSGTQQGPPPTPDSAMLRVLRTAELGLDGEWAAAGGGGENDPAHLVMSYAGAQIEC